LIQSAARVLLLALAYLLAACGGGTTGTASPTRGPIVRGTPVAVSTEPAPPTAAVAAPSAETAPISTTQVGVANLLISYHKSGGIAGVDETLTVYADGTIELRRKSGTITAQANPADVESLQALLLSPEFATLQLPVQPAAPDQFAYELTVPGRTKPIVAVDSADNPAVLSELIAALEKLKTQAK
jgi:hypothetical protein